VAYTQSNSPGGSTEAPNFLDPFFVIETTCTAWFTLEAIVRFIACPSKIDFWKDFKNIVDVTADVRNIQVRVQDGAVSSTVSAAPKLFYVARVFLGVKRTASST